MHTHFLRSNHSEYDRFFFDCVYRVKTIRYYADIGLVKETGRTATGYRTYDETAVKRLIFVRRSREFGFSISQTEELLALYSDEKRSSAEVKAIAQRRLVEIEAKQKELEILRKELSNLVQSCHGDDRPNCPIMDYLG
jgi:Cu(I)-responsive transcriptional regulator